MTEESRIEVELIPPSDEEGHKRRSQLISLASEACETVFRMRREARESRRITSETVARIREESRLEIERMHEDYRSRRMALDMLSDAAGQAVANGSIEKTKIALDRIVNLALTPSSCIQAVHSDGFDTGSAVPETNSTIDVAYEDIPESKVD